MAFNVQTFIEKLSKELDKALIHDAATGFLAGGSLQAEFAGSDSVLIAEMAMSGLGDYDRQAGFPKGGVAMKKTPYRLSMERGRQFSIDIRDMATNDLKEACGSLAEMMKIFQTEYVKPEVDAYNLSAIGANALSKNVSKKQYTTASTDIVKDLIYDVDKAQEVANGEELFIFLNWGLHGFLAANTEFMKYIDVANFKKGEVNTELKTINGAGIVKVPAVRMYNQYMFLNGVDADQKNGGFAPTAEAKQYNWIILPRSAANCITVLEKSQVITPDNNNDGLAYKQGYRRLYDTIIKESRKQNIIVSAQG